MRYIVIGAGAIGGTIGGRLAANGHEVVLVARGRHLDALQARGLRLAPRAVWRQVAASTIWVLAMVFGGSGVPLRILATRVRTASPPTS